MFDIDKKAYTIKNKKIVKLTEEDCIKLEKLKIKFNSELSLENPNIKILYRGENLEKVKRKLNTDDLDTTFEKVFTLGEKSNSLFIPSSLNNYFRVDNVNDQVFTNLFTKINEVLNLPNLTPKLSKFILNNQKFTEYFSDMNNLEDFINKINQSSKKLFLKDYYMAFLHTEGNTIRDESYFLSTSLEKEIAKKFTLKASIDNRITFCYFINKPYLEYGIYSSNKGYLKKEIDNCSLVSYSPLHENEAEFSIRGGFLPHYILYLKFHKRRKEKLLFNPFIFVDEYDLNNSLENGFPVDQENFIYEIKKTNYNGYFEQDDKGTTQYDL